MRPITQELKNAKSPVRAFFDEWFPHTQEVRRRYRQEAASLTVPSSGAAAGTVGTAADWLLRFLLHPHPDVRVAMAGASDLGDFHVVALTELARQLGATLPDQQAAVAFTGPVAGSTVDQEVLARGCWALALLTELYRSPQAYRYSPLAAAPPPVEGADDLLALAAPPALLELARFREVFEDTLIPRLAPRTGTWALGPRFSGSKLIPADADLIAAGLLLDLKTSLGDKHPDGTRRLKLDKNDLYQLIGYTLLDFDDEHHVSDVGIFSARFEHLAIWPLKALLGELAGQDVDLPGIRREFTQLLRRHR